MRIAKRWQQWVTTKKDRRMNLYLRLKHWQVFIILIFGQFLANFEIEIQGYENLQLIINVIGQLIYFSWGLFVGHGLYQIIPVKIKVNYNLFLINTFIILAAEIVLRMFFHKREFAFHGLAVLPGFYLVYAFLQYMIFPAIELRSIENDRKADVGECIGDFFLIFLLPIGIWFLQPRINRVIEATRETEIQNE